MCWSNWPSCSIVAPAWLLKATGPMCKYFVHCSGKQEIRSTKMVVEGY